MESIAVQQCGWPKNDRFGRVEDVHAWIHDRNAVLSDALAYFVEGLCAHPQAKTVGGRMVDDNAETSRPKKDTTYSGQNIRPQLNKEGMFRVVYF